MPLITLADLKAQLNIAESDTMYDAELGTYVPAAIEAVELARGEVIDQRSVTERVRSFDGCTFLLASVPVISLTSVAEPDGISWAIDEFDATPDGVVVHLSGSALARRLQVTYQAGYATPPTRYKLAALIIGQHLWETQRGAVSGGGGALGAEETYAPGPAGFALPRRALELLGDTLSGVA